MGSSFQVLAGYAALSYSSTIQSILQPGVSWGEIYHFCDKTFGRT